jgi:hypothetical protein
MVEEGDEASDEASGDERGGVCSAGAGAMLPQQYVYCAIVIIIAQRSREARSRSEGWKDDSA